MKTLDLEKNTVGLVTFLLLLFPVLINSIKVFGNLILLIFAIVGLYLVFFERQNPFKIQEIRMFSCLTSGYFVVMLLSILYADGLDAELHHLGRKVHFLLAPLIALTIAQTNIPLKKLLLSIKAGLIILGIITIIQALLGHERPSGMINANIFGDITVAMLFLAIVKIFSETPKERVITLAAILGGSCAIVLSENRGSWLSFLILFIVYIRLIYKPFLKDRIKYPVLLILAILFMIGLAGMQNGADKRISQAVDEIHNWQSGSESGTSLGLRMEMWQSGLSAVKESPWLGYGYRNANKIAASYAAHNNKTIEAFTHLHNEYITNLVSAGIVGLLSLLMLLLWPMFVFYKGLSNPKTYDYALMGMLLCIGYITFGFSHIAFGEEHINAFYVLFMGLLIPKVLRN